MLGVKVGPGVFVAVLVGVGVRVGVAVLVPVAVPVLVGVRVSVAVFVGAGGSPAIVNLPEVIQRVPTKTCTSYSPASHFSTEGLHNEYP